MLERYVASKVLHHTYKIPSHKWYNLQVNYPKMVFVLFPYNHTEIQKQLLSSCNEKDYHYEKIITK